MVSFMLFPLVSILAFTDCAILRQKRQTATRQRNRPSDEMIRILQSFIPQPSPNCPENYLACRDRSYCFKEQELCGRSLACNDGSDDYNGICLGTLPPNATASETRTESISPSTVPSTFDSPSYSSFRDPLVVAFIVLVCGLFIYVTIATYCWITNRWNVINPERMTS